MRSLKTSLLAWVTTATSGVILAAGCVLYVAARGYVLGELDRGLATTARLVASTVYMEAGELDIELQSTGLDPVLSGPRPGYMEVYLDGRLVFHAPRGARAPGLEKLSIERAGYGWVTLAHGGVARVVVHRWEAESGGGSPLLQGHEEEDGDEYAGLEGRKPAVLSLVLARDASMQLVALRRLAVSLVVIGLASVAVLTVSLWYGIHRGLGPVRRLGGSLAGRGQERLTEQVDVGSVPAELAPVVVAFNALLDRVAGVLERERMFSANAAHELRTPLAGLKTTIEVAALRVDKDERVAASLGTCLAIIGQMHELVETLLLLTRLGAGGGSRDVAVVGLADQVRAAWLAVGEAVRDPGVEARFSLVDGVRVRTDAALLGIALRNVLKNAAQYVDAGGVVEVGVAMVGGEAVVTVANTAAGVTGDDVGRVFEPFWRGDAARADTGRNFGIGLALARQAVVHAGGRVSASLEGGRFVVRITLPSDDRSL